MIPLDAVLHRFRDGPALANLLELKGRELCHLWLDTNKDLVGQDRIPRDWTLPFAKYEWRNRMKKPCRTVFEILLNTHGYTQATKDERARKPSLENIKVLIKAKSNADNSDRVDRTNVDEFGMSMDSTYVPKEIPKKCVDFNVSCLFSGYNHNLPHTLSWLRSQEFMAEMKKAEESFSTLGQSVNTEEQIEEYE